MSPSTNPLAHLVTCANIYTFNPVKFKACEPPESAYIQVPLIGKIYKPWWTNIDSMVYGLTQANESSIGSKYRKLMRNVHADKRHKISNSDKANFLQHFGYDIKQNNSQLDKTFANYVDIGFPNCQEIIKENQDLLKYHTHEINSVRQVISNNSLSNFLINKCMGIAKYATINITSVFWENLPKSYYGYLYTLGMCLSGVAVNFCDSFNLDLAANNGIENILNIRYETAIESLFKVISPPPEMILFYYVTKSVASALKNAYNNNLIYNMNMGCMEHELLQIKSKEIYNFIISGSIGFLVGGINFGSFIYNCYIFNGIFDQASNKALAPLLMILFGDMNNTISAKNMTKLYHLGIILDSINRLMKGYAATLSMKYTLAYAATNIFSHVLTSNLINPIINGIINLGFYSFVKQYPRQYFYLVTFIYLTCTSFVRSYISAGIDSAMENISSSIKTKNLAEMRLKTKLLKKLVNINNDNKKYIFESYKAKLTENPYEIIAIPEPNTSNLFDYIDKDITVKQKPQFIDFANQALNANFSVDEKVLIVVNSLPVAINNLSVENGYTNNKMFIYDNAKLIETMVVNAQKHVTSLVKEDNLDVNDIIKFAFSRIKLNQVPNQSYIIDTINNMLAKANCYEDKLLNIYPARQQSSGFIHNDTDMNYANNSLRI